MARPKANIPRTMMKVPINFHDDVKNAAKAEGISAVEYLENKKVVVKEVTR
jgi:hypothetical protein